MLEGKLIEIRLPTHAKPTSIQESTIMIASPFKQASQTIEQTREAGAEGAPHGFTELHDHYCDLSCVYIIIVVVSRKMHGTTASK